MFAASYGVAFGAIQHLPQIVPGINEVKAEVKAKTEGKPEAEIKKIVGATNFEAADYTKSAGTRWACSAGSRWH